MENAAEMRASITIDKAELKDEIIQGLALAQKQLDANGLKVEVSGDLSELNELINRLQKTGLKDFKIGVADDEIKNAQKLLDDIITKAKSKGINIEIEGLSTLGKAAEQMGKVGEAAKKVEEYTENLFKDMKLPDASDTVSVYQKLLDMVDELNKNIGSTAKVTMKTDGEGMFNSATITYYNEALKQTVAETYRLETSTDDAGTEINKLVLAQRRYTDAIKQRTDAEAKITTQTNNWDKQIEGFKDAGIQVDSYKVKLTELISKVNQYKTLDVYGKDKIQAKELAGEINNLVSKLQNMSKPNAKGELLNFKDLAEASEHFQDIGYKITSVNDKTGEFTAQLKQADGSLKTVKVSADAAGDEIRAAFNTSAVKSMASEINNVGTVLTGIKGVAAQVFRIYLSPMDFIRYFRQAVTVLKEFDNGLTTMSYTMNISQQQLDKLGESVLEMANTMKTSVSDAMSIAQIYANMESTPEKIIESAQPTIVLKNLTGMSAEDASNQVQAVMQQFGILEENSMHIADVYDYLSSRIAVDYSKGIETMAASVEVAGDTARQAGLSFEQLSAITAKVAERTRMDQAKIGNGLKTIFTRLSKVGKLSDEVDNETLSKASESLHKIGIEVYNLDGSYREFDVIMQELSNRWNSLTDAQKANLSFSIAATRLGESRLCLYVQKCA